MYKIWADKKGVGIDDFIPLLLTLFFFIFFLGFLVIVSTNQNNETRANAYEVQEKIVSQDVWVRYLAGTDSGQIRMDSLIELASKNQLESKKQELEAYFDRIYFIGGSNSWRSWGVTVKIGEQQAIDVASSHVGTNQGGLSRELLGRVVVPIEEKIPYVRLSPVIDVSTDKIAVLELFKRGRASGIEPQPLEMP